MNDNLMNDKLSAFLFWVVLGLMLMLPISDARGQASHQLPEHSPAWGYDFKNSMAIPGGIAMASSETHQYLLSETEGLLVFRIQSESLQWLYTSSGMQARGNRLQADIRFAYLYGNTRRLTVLEPTSVLGVYSSTLLPSIPVAVTRLGDKLYAATRDSGVVVLDLTTPESVDEKPAYLELSGEKASVLDVVSDHTSSIFVLSGPTRLEWFQLKDKATVRVLEKAGDFTLLAPVHRLFLTGSELFATSTDGQIYRVATGGTLEQEGAVSGAIRQMSAWRNSTILFTETGELYRMSADGDLEHQLSLDGQRSSERQRSLDGRQSSDGQTSFQSQQNTEASGSRFLSVLEDRLWVYQNEELTPLLRTDSATEANEGISTKEDTDRQPSNRFLPDEKSLLVQKPDPVTVPFATPVLLPVPFEARGYRLSDLSFDIESASRGAVIRDGSFLWIPTASQTGTHTFDIHITTPEGTRRSTRFEITVRPFNRPPQFVPLRPLTVAADTFFETYFSAFDPDGSDRELVRFLGMDLPDGALVDEKTGRFTWTPTLRQTGSHSFRIIATDQYGAAAETSMTIEVVEIDESDEYRFEPPEPDQP